MEGLGTVKAGNDWEKSKLVQDFCAIDAEIGLPEDVFLAASAVVPIANVDLLILDEKKRLLLSWRDDNYFGKGWHLPGGCIRFKETMLERVHKTAINELGVDVAVEDGPIAVKDVIVEKENRAHRIRAHQLAVLFCCRISSAAVDTSGEKRSYKPGELRWFKEIPHDILAVHDVYNEVFRKYGLLK